MPRPMNGAHAPEQELSTRPPAAPAGACTKCGSSRVALAYAGPIANRSEGVAVRLTLLAELGPWPEGEFLLASCNVCGFAWAAPCLAGGGPAEGN